MVSSPEPIAIVGAGCRFPGGASRPSKLWELLQSPRNVATPIPKDRFSLDAFYHPSGPHHGTTNVKESYFLSEIDALHFDAAFFNMAPSEADPMDPQHRHLLEVVYEAMEDAGIMMEELQGSNTSVFVGLMCTDYYGMASRDLDAIPTYGATGVAASNASSRISYFFDWHGACMTIDTACSSSLVALHQAVNDLRNGSSKVSVVAGTNLLLDPLPYISESNLNMLSPTGRSRMWDAGADGYARGDGVAAVILKTLSQAIRDGDQIDCIIRETGANQDGRTSGITMPSGMAQAALIRDTYNRAGLNPLKPLERCQYFEAHGTGTPAGDPQEASALAAAFFDDEERDDILYVGSVKTVIGHTEGTAGLAGVLKAYNAIKNKTIPPNLLFNELSPAVEPYYKHLQILNDAIPWPELPAGVPRRASVNSFGFGGSNAHAILESYEKKVEGNNTSLSLLPFVFSANSETSLQALLESYAEYIKANPSLNMDSLRYTLANKRSALSHRTFFVADSAESLASQLESRLRVCREEKEPIGLKPQGTPEIIAIFTGQGAQWAGMGREFVQTFPPARQLIKNLDDSLATLPESDRPNWSIFTELTEPTTPNQINEASLSQPLCTALQIVLVDLLRSTGTEFKAVVGHSSGEIAAAFAAGFISASDAIRIAYYRGLHVKLAHGVAGEKGTMMAVGTSFEDAKEVCELEDFEDRIHVAAVNSSSSVTLSGDEEVLKQAQEVFQNEKKFARMLKVDTAYHSHHMLPCAVPYEKSLRACNIQVLTPTKNAPVWISSVRESEDMGVTKDLEAQYWVDNMTSPVLFHQALEHTLKTKGTFTLGLEIGPHPALQGPAMQTMQETVDDVIPYSGTFYRSKANDVAVADALGASWTGPGSTGSNWIQFVEKCWGDTKTIPVLKDLPTYPWDHSRLFRSESRYAKHLRTQESRVHPLLGQKTADGTGESIIRWKNILKPKELQWLSGHALQGQLVFPGTGYIALAMEAAMEIAAGRPVESIELLDLAITRAIAIDELLGTEIVVAMTELSGHLEKDPGVITGHFTSFSSISRESPDLQVNAFGNVRINMGTFTAGALLPREDRDLEMTPVDVDDFYSAMEDLGYGYAGEFKALSKIERRLGFAKGTISRPPMDKDERPLLFHPGMLDTALQTLFAAFSAPGDERLWALHAPSGIRRVTLVPSLCGRSFPEQVEFDSMITAARPNHITGDVDLISADGIHKCIEIDGLGFVPFTAATESDDRTLFSKVTWGLEEPDGALALGRSDAADAENLKALERERVAFFYLRKIFENRPSSVEDYQEALLEFAQHVQDQVRKGKHPYATKEWLSDTREQILELIKKRGHDADLNLLHAVGENMPAILRNEITTLEVMTKDGMLDEYYEGAQGFQPVNVAIAAMLGQIAHRYPHANILEIGAGTGGATKGILQTLKTAFTSYTYTDISPGFFLKARETFKEYASRMVFKTLDVTKDPIEQGYKENAYDIIIASNVLHATPFLEETLANTRRLLKPGGFLIMLEIVKIDTLAVGLTMGGLPGWWIGRKDGRIHSPTITIPQWDTVLKSTGFSGVETSTPDIGQPFIASVFVSRAVNPQFDLLRSPLSSGDAILGDVVLIGGKTSKTASQMDFLKKSLEPRSTSLIVVPTIEDLKHHDLAYGSTVLSLADVDAPVLDNLTAERWTILQKLLPQARSALWVTSGYIDEQPYAGAIVGLHRCTAAEIPELRMQLLDVDVLDRSGAAIIVEQLLRSKILAQNQEGGDVLYSLEPELMLKDGKLKFYRAMPDTDANNRYNSAKRRITKDVNPHASSVQLEWDEPTDSFSLREEKQLAVRSDLVNISVSYSSLSSIMTAGGLTHVGIGENTKTGQSMLFFSNKNTSIAAVPSAYAVRLTGAPNEKAKTLKSAIAYLLSRQIATHLHAGATAVIHEPDGLLAQVLRAHCQDTGVKLVFATTVEGERDPDWVTLHARMARRHLARALPANVDLLVDLSHGGGGLGSRIKGALPSRCKHIDLFDLLSKDAAPVGGGAVTSKLLNDTTAFIDEQASKFCHESRLEVSSLVDVVSTAQQQGPFAMVDWTYDASVPTALEPVDCGQDLFKPDKTYWMVGLAGDLGQSICDWMIDHGARNIVLTSRSNKVPERWINACRARGATVAFVAGDITSDRSMQNAHTEITKRLPPIAGVANGALILRDKLFINTTFEDINAIMSPKTTGTIILDKLFPEDTLDWFIAFSSVVATSGNTGQCAYSAANMFMKTVVNDRRKRGLAGTSIDISRVHGVGYVERNAMSLGLSKKEMDKIQRFALSMSEPDLHQLFAEAVIASRPDSGRHSDLITGIRSLTSRDVADVFWAASLRFSHFVNDVEPTAGGATDNRQTRVVVKTQLKSAKSPDDVVAIIKTAFTAKLTASLEHDESNALPDSTPLVDFGMDSLVAVEIRSWFLKELEVEVPVLRIMGGATIADLVADAVEKLPAEISLIGGEQVVSQPP